MSFPSLIPPVLYYAVPGDNIEMLQKEDVYASNNPVFAVAARCFSSSDQDVELFLVEDGNLEKLVPHIEVPVNLFEKLSQPISLCSLEGRHACWLQEDPVKGMYRNVGSVRCMTVKVFETAYEAIHLHGGKIFISA